MQHTQTRHRSEKYKAHPTSGHALPAATKAHSRGFPPHRLTHRTQAEKTLARKRIRRTQNSKTNNQPQAPHTVKSCLHHNTPPPHPAKTINSELYASATQHSSRRALPRSPQGRHSTTVRGMKPRGPRRKSLPHTRAPYTHGGTHLLAWLRRRSRHASQGTLKNRHHHHHRTKGCLAPQCTDYLTPTI